MKLYGNRLYRPGLLELLTVSALFGAGAVCISLLFYDSLLGIVPLLIPLIYLLHCQFLTNKQRKMQNVMRQFQNFLEAMETQLYAGVSLENSYIRGIETLRQQEGASSAFMRALTEGERKLAVNTGIDRVFLELAEQTEIEEIWNFANLIAISRKKGGNMLQIMRQAAEHLNEALRVEQEIQVLIAAKKMEHRIMCLMPFGMMLYMKLTSAGYFNALYHNAFGVCFMSGCLIVIFAAYRFGERIMRIGF